MIIYFALITISLIQICSAEAQNANLKYPYKFKSKGNPFVEYMYTADPTARVFNDTLYVYPSHDRDTATWFNMDDWHVLSTTDMKNWTDHGVCLSLKDLPWAQAYAWAPDCVYNLFYHNSNLFFEKNKELKPECKWPQISCFRRSIGVDKLYYNQDGTIKEVIPTKEGVTKIAKKNK